MKRKTILYTNVWLLIFGSLILLYGCDTDESLKQLNSSDDYELIYDYIKKRPDLSVYKNLCDYTGFSGTVSTGGAYTILAPLDSAFQKLYKQLGINDFKEKPAEYWLHYLQYHAIEQTINTSTMESGEMTQPTLLGKEFKLTVDISRYPYILINNSASIVEPNIKKQNGNINLLDGVLSPPIATLYELLEQNGGYSQMLAMFEKHGLKSYLTDSLITIMVEPDAILSENGILLDTISHPEEWLKYHIIPNERSFVTDLDSRYIKTLYSGEGITFNFINSDMWCNRTYRFSKRASYPINEIAINGVLHSMEDPLMIREHTAGKVRYNLYGRDNDKRGYKRNVFPIPPAMVVENVGMASFHQDKKVPCCQFYPSQVGDECYTLIPDIVPGTYTIRLIYYASGAPDISIICNNSLINSNLVLSSKSGDFTEWTTLQYKDCGTIDLLTRGDVELRFKANTNSSLVFDMIELIPIIQ